MVIALKDKQGFPFTGRCTYVIKIPLTKAGQGRSSWRLKTVRINKMRGEERCVKGWCFSTENLVKQSHSARKACKRIQKCLTAVILFHGERQYVAYFRWYGWVESSRKVMFFSYFYSSIFIANSLFSDIGGVYFGGVPVPGRRVSALTSFEMYLDVCRPNSQSDNYIFRQIQQVWRKGQAPL